MPRFKFSENNSGGSWWLNKENYEALFAAGWTYEPPEESVGFTDLDKPFLGGDVPYGWRHHLFLETDSIKDAVESFEKATGQDFFEEGCNCCGAPFSIENEETYDYLSGDSVDRTVIRPF